MKNVFAFVALMGLVQALASTPAEAKGPGDSILCQNSGPVSVCSVAGGLNYMISYNGVLSRGDGDIHFAGSVNGVEIKPRLMDKTFDELGMTSGQVVGIGGSDGLVQYHQFTHIELHFIDDAGQYDMDHYEFNFAY